MKLDVKWVAMLSSKYLKKKDSYLHTQVISRSTIIIMSYSTFLFLENAKALSMQDVWFYEGWMWPAKEKGYVSFLPPPISCTALTSFNITLQHKNKKGIFTVIISIKYKPFLNLPSSSWNRCTIHVHTQLSVELAWLGRSRPPMMS